MPHTTKWVLAVSLLCMPARALSPPTWRTETLATGAALSVMYAGAPPGSAPVILFLHGFPEGSYSWWPLLAAGHLDAYTLVAPDQRGYNASFAADTAGDASLLVSQLAADALALIDLLGGAAHVVAHDWGGGVAWWLACQQLPAMLSLTILNMPHPMGWWEGIQRVPAQQQASAYVLSFIRAGFSDYLTADDSAVLRSWFKNDQWFAGAAEAALAASWRVRGSVNASLGWYRENVRVRAPPNCTEWQCFDQGVSGPFGAMPNNGSLAPALRVRVLWGMADTAFDNEWQLAYMAAKVPAAQLAVTRYPAASHWIAQELPEEMARQVAAFVGGGGGGGGAPGALAMAAGQ